VSDSLPTRRTAIKTGAAATLAAGLSANAQPAKKIGKPLIEGYTDQLSYTPGDEIKVHLSAPHSMGYSVVRVGPKPLKIDDGDRLKSAVHPVPKDASSHGCQWPAAFTLKTSPEWPTGYYQILFSDEHNNRGSVFFVLRPRETGKNARILIQLATNTYNAYTNWGGYSLYAYHGRHKVQGRRVSFDRPQYSQFSRWEEPFIKWAEASGYALDYCVNSDLEFRPEILKPYKLVLSVGHDEYWSAPMRDNLEKYIAGGGNVAFFSGNTCCWQVRTEENGRALACWKQSFGDDPYYKSGNHKLLTSLWGHYLVGRPENALTGVGFLHGGYHMSHGQYMDGPGSYIAHRPDHWLFAGTDLKRGDRFGASLPKYKVVGYECDGCELTWKDGLPYPTHRDGTPDNFEVLATCPAQWHPDDCEWYEKWEKGRVGNAVIGTYTHPGGGAVVTVGSTDWAFGLRGNDPAVVRITKNVLDRLAT
jgi:hypothetical protein